MMKLTKNASGTAYSSALKLLIGPFDREIPTEQTELSVPTAAPGIVVVGAVTQRRYQAIVRNTSTGAQLIRITPAPTLPSFVAPVTGIPLRPGDQLIFTDMSVSLLAIANAPGALLSRFIVHSSGIGG